jgi:class 3 adenylate cyclase
VNTASRVESATRATDDDVLITDATRRLLKGDRDGSVERPPMPLTGKADEVHLFAPAAGEASQRCQMELRRRRAPRRRNPLASGLRTASRCAAV